MGAASKLALTQIFPQPSFDVLMDETVRSSHGTHHNPQGLGVSSAGRSVASRGKT